MIDLSDKKNYNNNIYFSMKKCHFFGKKTFSTYFTNKKTWQQFVCVRCGFSNPETCKIDLSIQESHVSKYLKILKVFCAKPEVHLEPTLNLACAISMR